VEKKELSNYFVDQDSLMEIYSKIYQSLIYTSEDGSSWFTVIFKKKTLIDKNTIISNETNENYIASKLFLEEFSDNNNSN
jgi:hypothetical protein